LIAKYFSELSLTELYEILRARSQIFVVQQHMHCQDIDGIDIKAKHFFIEKDGEVMAYLRAFYDDDRKKVRIGRVLAVEQGIGMGAEVMHMAIEDIKKNMPCQKICLDSQKHAIGFYQKLGFQTVSGEFLEEGVLHVKMELQIN